MQEIRQATRSPTTKDAISASSALASNQRVIALVEDVRAYQHLVHALRGHARVERAENWEALLLAIRRGSASAVVLELFATQAVTPEWALRHLLGYRQVARLVLLCHLDARTVETLVRLPRPVADSVIVVGAHDDASIRSRVLARVGVRDAVARLRRMEVGRIAPKVAPSFERCLSRLEREIDHRLSVADLARNAGWTRVHLERVFAQSVKVSPKKMIGLVYALLAVALLELRPRSLARLAEELQFSSPDALCRSVKRSTGLTLIEISERGGLMYLLNVFNATFGVRVSSSRSDASCDLDPVAADAPVPPVTEQPGTIPGAALEFG